MISYSSRATWLHRVPAGLKLALLAAASLAVLPIEDWRWLAAALLGAAALYLSFGAAGTARLRALARLWPMMALIAAFHLAFGSWQGAAANVARLWLMIALADLVTMSTNVEAMIGALAPVLRPLSLVGLSHHAVALAVALVIRFVPLMMENWQARSEAWRARGGGRLPLRLVAPFAIETLRMADRAAESLAARGFGLRGDRETRQRGPS